MNSLIGKTITDVVKRDKSTDVSEWEEYKVTCSDGTVLYFKCVSFNTDEFTAGIKQYTPKKPW